MTEENKEIKEPFGKSFTKTDDIKKECFFCGKVHTIGTCPSELREIWQDDDFEGVAQLIDNKIKDAIQLTQSRIIEMISEEAKEWIEFKLRENKTKTQVWDVIAKRNDESIGIIRYYPIWRHYCYFPHSETFYSDRCQIAIGFFIKKLNEELQSLKKEVKE